MKFLGQYSTEKIEKRKIYQIADQVEAGCSLNNGPKRADTVSEILHFMSVRPI